MAQKPSIPKGTRDFSPQEMVRRNYIFDTIKKTFQRYGYLPIETPAMENLETLMGKYGDEGDKLIFKIRSNKSLKEKFTKDKRDLIESVYPYWLPQASDKALRYDLTVPFARFVVQHQEKLAFPFKRYQIQPVWRADNPQKGRYREFYQCDADVIGSNSLLNEVELMQIIYDVFSTLKLPVTIKVNNRKILSGIAEVIGEKDKIVPITVAMDKLDKIGLDGVNKELFEKGVSTTAISKLQPLLTFKGHQFEKVSFLKQLLRESEIGMKGMEEIDYMFDKIRYLLENRIILKEMVDGKIDIPFDNTFIELDLTLARGLNYYTGAIFEVKANVGTLNSSICGGGRYDDLTGIFGLPNMSGVGISFGADRIYDVLNEMDLYPDTVAASTKLLFVTFGEIEQNYCLPLLYKVRKAGINAEVYPDANAKMKKQMGYADDKKVPFVVIVGGDEMQSGQLAFKNMTSGEQEKLTIDQIIERLM